jgi:hypothetical protein
MGLKTIRDLTAWLHGYEARPLLARSHLERTPLPITEADYEQFVTDLSFLEADLINETAKVFEAAKATFREISVELLRDLNGMRREVLSIVGADLFQTSVAIALAIAGLKLADFAAVTTVLRVSLVVASLFAAGALLKSVTQAKEFRRLIEFNRSFERLPVASAMPEFHSWYKDTIEESVRLFYASVAIGRPIAGIPIFGVLALLLGDMKVMPVPLAFLLMLGAAAAGALAYWHWGPRTALLKKLAER